ncbi:MAG: methyltransferase domain-containing protein [Acidobacteria bacterium]|nr:methyltransferase domain-containing protein [Acidobacteriota bacterium]
MFMRGSAARRLSALAAGTLAAGLMLVVLDAQGRHPISGRVIAPVMGVGGAGWLERPEREAEEAPSIAIRALQLKKGQVVADIGAGSGYYTMRMADAVGPEGKVYATDIQTGMLDIVRRRVAAARLTNVETVLSAPDDPKLPADSLDLAIMVDVYHELSAPQEFIRRLRPALKRTGRLVLLEFRKEDPRVPIRPEHKMSIAEVKAELEPEGFKLSTVLNDLPWQHIIVLTRSDAP